MRAAPAPLFTWHDLLAWVDAQRTAGRRFCLAWGAFDQLTRDEVDYLQFAAGWAEQLVVLVLPSHFFDRGLQHDTLFRAARLQFLSAPDAVGIPEDGPMDAARVILPEVVCPPSLPRAAILPWHELVRPYGGQVVVFPRGRYEATFLPPEAA